jgi:hypothetical protein
LVRFGSVWFGLVSPANSSAPQKNVTQMSSNCPPAHPASSYPNHSTPATSNNIAPPCHLSPGGGMHAHP